MTCHAPMSAASRSSGSSLESSSDSAKAGPERITSSEKSSTAHPSIPHARPTVSAVGCSSLVYESAIRLSASLRRSTLALALSGHSPSWSDTPHTRHHSWRHITSSSLAPCELRQRFSRTRPTICICSLMPSSMPAARSTALLTTLSMAMSRYSSSRTHPGSLPELSPASKSSCRTSTHASTSAVTLLSPWRFFTKPRSPAMCAGRRWDVESMHTCRSAPVCTLRRMTR
mmetsp:Transcript_27654/g.94386  ORF Transcript_27654/g.94386 Transcript_27654/m.94386 type:complete len:229 (+) Transcript_27654:341-1027(+)